ncbi:uncharacterized protein [Coffea arabica]|uniref:Uncharacterized protein isoform X2 n=1 Tax=Coffea arabica TaxID=13443 RepID=A0ABM4W6P9_COFAR
MNTTSRSSANFCSLIKDIGVGSYECSWILNYKTLIENYAEPVPPMLPCILELTNFSDLHKYADSDNLCTLSFITRYSSGILISPPLPDDLSFKQWFTLNKEEIQNLLNAKTYSDANCLLPPPNEEDIKAISTFQASFPIQKAAWVQGTVKLAYGFTKYWTTACVNCYKIVNADID